MSLFLAGGMGTPPVFPTLGSSSSDWMARIGDIVKDIQGLNGG